MFNKLTLAIVITVPFLLASCGGGSDSSSSSSVTNTPDVIIPDNENPTPDTTLPKDDPKPDQDSPDTTVNDEEGISEVLLADDTPLPQPPANTNPLAFLDSDTDTKQFTDGIYEYGLSYISSFNDYIDIDCSDSSDEPCPTIINYRYDANQKRIISKQWAYMPIQKIWIELENDSEFITLPEFNLHALDLVTGKRINEIKFLDTPVELKQNSLNYQFGGTVFEVSALKYNLTNQSYYSSLSDSMASYSTDAKVYKLFAELSEGEIFVQNELGELGIYGSAADFRNNHVNVDEAICFNNNYLVFKPRSLGVISYRDNSGEYYCDPYMVSETPVETSSLSIDNYYEEGVRTLNNDKLLYLSNYGSDTGDTSSLQYLPAFHISAGGAARLGQALQEGYAFEDSKFYFNKVAIQDWIKTKYNEPEALNLPSL